MSDPHAPRPPASYTFVEARLSGAVTHGFADLELPPPAVLCACSDSLFLRYA